jgi:hypothetical protein
MREKLSLNSEKTYKLGPELMEFKDNTGSK